MATPNLAERLELDGVPLSTPAWEVEDLSPLWDLAGYRGDDLEVPYRRGVVPFRRQLGGKVVDLPFVILGDYDPDGQPAVDPRAQLWANRRELVRTVLRPRQVATNTGDSIVRYYAPDGETYAGPGKIVGGLKPTAVGPAALRGSLALSLSEGGLRDETESDQTSAQVSDGNQLDFAVANDGDDYQDELRLTLTGTATVVRLTNLTADAGGDVWWEFGGSLDTGVAVDTSDFSAVRDGVSVTGLVTHSGFERWLPLVPGSNTVRIEPTGGTVTVRFQHFPFYP
jgi:hypothetical protein